MKKLILILGLILPMASANAADEVSVQDQNLTAMSLNALEQSSAFQMALARMQFAHLADAADSEGGMSQERFEIRIGGKVYYTNDWQSFSSCLKGIGTVGACGGAFIAAELGTVGGATVAIGAFLVCAATAMDDIRFCISQ